MIKNRETQKNIKHEIALLNKQSLQEKKNYLRQKNLIKIGTNAPPDVINQLYLSAKLSGDLHNSNGDNLLFNYLNS